MISLAIISGRSGSGKSTALHVLEDLGYYCIDNLPVTLLDPLIRRLAEEDRLTQAAVSIDARNIAGDLVAFPQTLSAFDKKLVDATVIYLDAASPALVKRFSETRRKHPLSDKQRSLRESLDMEKELLSPISELAQLTVDTTDLTLHGLRDLIRTRVAGQPGEFALLFQSFAFKRGVPVDADIVFDVRCLPNPHWKPELRNLTGLDEPVRAFLAHEPDVARMQADIEQYLDHWLPQFEASGRRYLTVAIGCTGGQHRSVFISNALLERFKSVFTNVQIRHRELANLRTQAE